MDKKKKGFTLLETIITISMLMIIFASGTSLGIMKSNIENEIKKDSDIYEIQNLLTLSKAKCKKDNTTGKLLINKKENKLYFYSAIDKGSPFRTISLSNDSDYLAESSNIFLNHKGRLLSADTIYVKNNDEVNSVTIGVGVDTVRIKD